MTCRELAVQYRQTAAKVFAVMVDLAEKKKSGNLIAHRQWCLAFSMYKDLIDTAKSLERYG